MQGKKKKQECEDSDARGGKVAGTDHVEVPPQRKEEKKNKIKKRKEAQITIRREAFVEVKELEEKKKIEQILQKTASTVQLLLCIRDDKLSNAYLELTAFMLLEY